MFRKIVNARWTRRKFLSTTAAAYNHVLQHGIVGMTTTIDLDSVAEVREL